MLDGDVKGPVARLNRGGELEALRSSKAHTSFHRLEKRVTQQYGFFNNKVYEEEILAELPQDLERLVKALLSTVLLGPSQKRDKAGKPRLPRHRNKNCRLNHIALLLPQPTTLPAQLWLVTSV